jgi:hypothetical protein
MYLWKMSDMLLPAGLEREAVYVSEVSHRQLARIA